MLISLRFPINLTNSTLFKDGLNQTEVIGMNFRNSLGRALRYSRTNCSRAAVALALLLFCMLSLWHLAWDPILLA